MRGALFFMFYAFMSLPSTLRSCPEYARGREGLRVEGLLIFPYLYSANYGSLYKRLVQVSSQIGETRFTEYSQLIKG